MQREAIHDKGHPPPSPVLALCVLDMSVNGTFQDRCALAGSPHLLVLADGKAGLTAIAYPFMVDLVTVTLTIQSKER